MTKFRLYYDKDKETAYLNDMSQNGYALTGFFSGFYRFDRCQPGKYVYQVDITEGLWKVSDDYREFMRDMGVEIVCLWGPWVILRKKAEEGPFMLYTDMESSIAHYAKIKMMFKVCAALEIFFCIIELISALNGYVVGWVFCLLLGAVAAMFVREVERVNRILEKLKGGSGDTGGLIGRGRRKRPSALIGAGLFMNAVALLIPEVTGQYAHALGFLKGVAQGMALILMVFGCVFTYWNSRE